MRLAKPVRSAPKIDSNRVNDPAYIQEMVSLTAEWAAMTNFPLSEFAQSRFRMDLDRTEEEAY
jgi:hypothetical protein